MELILTYVNIYLYHHHHHHQKQATQWWKIFGEIECLALIIACLCHDLDHRGTNNSFQIKYARNIQRTYMCDTFDLN